MYLVLNFLNGIKGSSKNYIRHCERFNTVIASEAKQSFATRINAQIASEVPSSQRRFFVFLELPLYICIDMI